MQCRLHSDPMAEHVRVPTLALEPMLIGRSWTAGQARETIGLAAGVWTTDRSRAYRVAARL